MLGKVIFVGAGPGNPELLTLEAYRVLREADVVLYDALVGPEVLDLIPSRTQKIYVGKRATNHSHKQNEINELLLEMVTHNECVVRLKGGDTLIYARLTDELTVLQEAGIPYQVLAGVTTLSGTAAVLGVPLTSRDCGSELLITTVSTYSDLETCRAVTTFLKRGSGIAIYMPTFRGQHVLPNLLEVGADPELPLLLVVQATLPTQRQQSTNLGQADYEQLCAFSAGDPTICLLGWSFASCLSTAMLSTVLESVHVH